MQVCCLAGLSLDSVHGLDIVSGKGAVLAAQRGLTHEPAVVTLHRHVQNVSDRERQLVRLLRLVRVDHAIQATF